MFQHGPILLGQYRPLDSFLHRLDARSKIIPIVVVLVLALMTGSFVFYLSILLVLLLGLLYSGVGLRALARNFKPILVLVLITAVYHLFFSDRQSPVLYDLFGWKVTVGGLRMAGFYSLRLVLFISVAFLVTLTNSPSELAEAFAKVLKPLARLRVPVQELAMILFMAIRFIPILYEEFSAIRNAQIIRGVDFSGSLFQRLKKTTYIIIPVFMASIQRADEIAFAIEARGYSQTRRRTFYSHARFGGNEWSFVSGTVIFVLLIYWVTL